MNQDIRWKQRFNNYLKAFKQLSTGIEISQQKELSQLEEQGLIQSFEYTHELAWNVLKDYLTYMGINGLTASRDTTREAFKRGLINSGEYWMNMIKSRHLTSHTYDENLAKVAIYEIINHYYPLFKELVEKFKSIIENEENLNE